MLGHVEFVVHDSEGNIVQYAQGDNLITTTGSDCIASEIFGGTLGDCGAIGTFDFIAIGNGTGSSVAVGDVRLNESSGDDGFSTTGSVHNGEMARKQATITPDTTGSDTKITLVNSGDPFTFTTTNATIIRQSGLYSEGGVLDSNGATTGFGASELLAIQDLSPTVTVGDGDSLTVTWVVTIGSGP